MFNTSHCRIPLLAVAISLVLFALSPTDSFQISSTASTPFSSLGTRNNHDSKTRHMTENILSQPMSPSSFALKSAQEDNNGESTPVSVDAILGITASLVVLLSEYTLKTTGCGLPAGPFGIVGAVEGVSYLGVVGICANAALTYFSEEDAKSDTGANRIATALGLSAALVGIAVLGFQVVDYGYIPNAVPMEGGICK